MSASSTAEAENLAAGRAVWIGDTLCHVTAPLGMGSFGVVWEAECDGAGRVAVKEILCSSQTDLSRALYEVQLLWMLGRDAELAGLESVVPGEFRIPAYVAYDCAEPSADSQAYRVRLAMSRLPGEPLDRYLQGRREELDRAAAEAGVAAWSPWLVTRQVAEACRHARALLLQLVPTMIRIGAYAYHRDVNAHNILVAFEGRMDGVEEPKYGLVDFGLAVDSTRWRDAPGPDPQFNDCGEWRHLDVGGDCRYWPASAWLQFEVGAQELAEDAAFCCEYQTHLDLQGLGLTAMQVLIELLPAMPPLGTAGVEWLELQNLQCAWEEYWQTATKYWMALLDTFRNNGDWNHLKTEFISIGVHGEIARTLAALRQALGDAKRACGRGNSVLARSGSSDTQALLAALLVLISSGEDRGGATAWEKVLACLEPAVPTQCKHDGTHLPPPKPSGGLGRAVSSLSTTSSSAVLSADLLAAPANGVAAAALEAPPTFAVLPQAPSPGGTPSAPPARQRLCRSDSDTAEVLAGVQAAWSPPKAARACGSEEGPLETIDAPPRSLFSRLNGLAATVSSLAQAMERLEADDYARFGAGSVSAESASDMRRPSIAAAG